MNKKHLILMAVLGMALFYTGCKKDDPEVIIEVELITTLTYTLTPTDGGESVSLMFRDIDGEGGEEAIITGGTLVANMTYSGSLDLLNESLDPIESITEEIEETKEEHQFFFSSSISDLTVEYSDEDANADPIGLTSILTTGAVGTGTLLVTLKHEPIKDAEGVSDGDITNAGGETDISVTFPIDVQ